MHTAVGELARTGIDALRGLGYTFYQADRLTHQLTWAEAVHHNGLRFVRTMEHRIREAIPRRLEWQDRQIGDTNVTLLDAAGKSALETGMAALDLANAEARRTGRGVVMVRDSFGGDLLSALVPQSLDRGLPLLVLSRAHGLDQDSHRFDRTHAIIGVRLEGRRYIGARAACGAGTARRTPPLGDIFEALLADMSGSGVGAEIGRFLDGAPARSTVGSDFVVVSSQGPDDGDQDAWVRRLIGHFEPADGAQRGLDATQDLQARWLAALRDGLWVEDADWDNVFELVARIRVPTSERSRTHAG